MAGRPRQIAGASSAALTAAGSAGNIIGINFTPTDTNSELTIYDSLDANTSTKKIFYAKGTAVNFPCSIEYKIGLFIVQTGASSLTHLYI